MGGGRLGRTGDERGINGTGLSSVDITVCKLQNRSKL